MPTRSVFLSIALAILGCSGLRAGAAEQTIRVGLHYSDGAPTSVVVSGRGKGQAERSKGSFDGEMRIAASGRDVVLEHKGRKITAGRWVELWPAGEDTWLEIDGSAYRGRLRFEVQRDRGLKVINVIAVEDYVRGVVPNEMYSDEEAFKVQAVISRTLALYARDAERKHRRDGFDICATGHCQIYRGADSERPLSDAAIAATAGEVLTYRRRPIFSAYHANSGGMTQPVDEAWPGSVRRSFPYLTCVESPYDGRANQLPDYASCYEWQREVDPRKIGERLRARGRDVGEVRELVVERRTSTGRVRELTVVGTRRKARLTRPEEIRAVLGTPSVLLEIERGPRSFRISGRGRGHGVGLSQHGAFGMAKAGYRYDEILAYFYRGVALSQDFGRGDSRPLRAPDIAADAAKAESAGVS